MQRKKQNKMNKKNSKITIITKWKITALTKYLLLAFACRICYPIFTAFWLTCSSNFVTKSVRLGRSSTTKTHTEVYIFKIKKCKHVRYTIHP